MHHRPLYSPRFGFGPATTPNPLFPSESRREATKGLSDRRDNRRRGAATGTATAFTVTTGTTTATRATLAAMRRHLGARIAARDGHHPAARRAKVTAFFLARCRRGGTLDLLRCDNGRAEIGGQRQHGDLLADQLFDIAQERPFVLGAERDRLAIGAGARRPPDAVDIGFRHVRQFIVDDMRHAGHIDAARRDIGRHQHAAGAGLEVGERAFALRLALVAMDRFGNDAGIAELADDPIGAMLGAGEHQRAVDRLVLEHELQQRRLFGLVDDG